MKILLALARFVFLNYLSFIIEKFAVSKLSLIIFFYTYQSKPTLKNQQWVLFISRLQIN
jgi:hypothetical protein